MKRNIGLGRDEQSAIEKANELNAKQSAHLSIMHGRRVEIAKRNWAIDRNGLVELQFLRENAEALDRVCGIYFLMQDGHVVYVGQSINCYGRIDRHYQEGKKVFDSVYVVRTDADMLDCLEALYIKKFSPMYNVDQPISKRETAWGLRQTTKTKPQ